MLLQPVAAAANRVGIRPMAIDWSGSSLARRLRLGQTVLYRIRERTGARRMRVEAHIRQFLFGFLIVVDRRLRRHCGGLRRAVQRLLRRRQALCNQVPARHGTGHAEGPDGRAVQATRRAAFPRARSCRGISLGAAHGGQRIARGARVRRGPDDRHVVVAVRPPHDEVPGVRPAVPVPGPRVRRAVSAGTRRAGHALRAQ